jgi:hypothetical protein
MEFTTNEKQLVSRILNKTVDNALDQHNAGHIPVEDLEALNLTQRWVKIMESGIKSRDISGMTSLGLFLTEVYEDTEIDALTETHFEILDKLGKILISKGHDN